MKLFRREEEKGRIMKKFLLGLTTGVILAGSTAVYASNSIQALLFPAKVTFHVNGEIKELDGDQTSILNYNNKTYIPLRTFAESMGSRVDYSDISGPKVDVYLGSSNEQETTQPTNDSETELNGKWEPFQFGELPTIPADKDGSFRLGLDSPVKYGELKLGDPLQLQCWIANIVNNSTATVTNHNLEVEISTNQGDVVWQAKLPAIPTTSLHTQSTAQGATGFSFQWDQKDMNGNLVPPGQYRATLNSQVLINYTVVGKDGALTQTAKGYDLRTTVPFSIK
jgi:hypothetical protein